MIILGCCWSFSNVKHFVPITQRDSLYPYMGKFKPSLIKSTITKSRGGFRKSNQWRVHYLVPWNARQLVLDGESTHARNSGEHRKRTSRRELQPTVEDRAQPQWAGREGAAGMNHPLTPSPLSMLPLVQPNQKPEGKEAHGCSQTTDMGQNKGWRVNLELQMCHDHEK